MPHRPISVLTLLILGGCQAQIGAPSLALRPVEQQPVELPEPTREVQTPIDPALETRIAGFVTAAEEGDRAFSALRAQVAGTVAAAKGAAPGSEGWTVAQQALSTLDVARGSVHEAANGLDALRQEPGAAGTGSRAALESAGQHIQTIVEAEAQAVADLQAQLR